MFIDKVSFVFLHSTSAGLCNLTAEEDVENVERSVNLTLCRVLKELAARCPWEAAHDRLCDEIASLNLKFSLELTKYFCE